jgi:hypothetical protein
MSGLVPLIRQRMHGTPKSLRVRGDLRIQFSPNNTSSFMSMTNEKKQMIFFLKEFEEQAFSE